MPTNNHNQEDRMTTDKKLSYSLAEAADATGVSETTIRRAVNAGQLAGKRPFGERGRILITRDALNTWLTNMDAA